LIDELSSEEFRPEQYKDDYRLRVLDMLNAKIEGKEVSSVGPQVQRAQVIDIMDALKKSLEKRVSAEKKPAVKARSSQAADAKPEKRAQAGRR
jgi:DNA end-binding protein Ku